MSYSPSRFPVVSNLEELRGFVEQEFQRISRELAIMESMGQLEVLHVAPEKPRDGMIVYADGTNWNPGAGDGFYGREGGAWVKL